MADDAQAITHQRIGRRAAPLREDAAAVREGDDVVHREKVSLIAQLPDQGQFALDDLAHLRARALRQRSRMPRSTSLRSQVAGVLTFRHQFARILVAQFIQM